MLRKVISGGQKGVERAALKVARKLMIETGGYIPRWRAEEDESLVRVYRLELLAHANFVQAAEQNVTASEGVLILNDGELTGNAALNRRLAERHRRPVLLVDMGAGAFDAASRIEAWLSENAVTAPAVTGTKSSGGFDAEAVAADILETAFQMMLIDPRRYDPAARGGSAEDQLARFIRIPKSVEEAVQTLMKTLSFHDRTRIANMPEERLKELTASLSTYIRNEFRLWGGNDALVADCRALAGDASEDPSLVIIRSFRGALRSSGNILRRIK